MSTRVRSEPAPGPDQGLALAVEVTGATGVPDPAGAAGAAPRRRPVRPAPPDRAGGWCWPTASARPDGRGGRSPTTWPPTTRWCSSTCPATPDRLRSWPTSPPGPACWVRPAGPPTTWVTRWAGGSASTWPWPAPTSSGPWSSSRRPPASTTPRSGPGDGAPTRSWRTSSTRLRFRTDRSPAADRNGSPASTPSCSSGSARRCSPASPPRRSTWSSAAATRRPAWPRASAWPARAPSSRCGSGWPVSTCRSWSSRACWTPSSPSSAGGWSTPSGPMPASSSSRTAVTPPSCNGRTGWPSWCGPTWTRTRPTATPPGG